MYSPFLLTLQSVTYYFGGVSMPTSTCAYAQAVFGMQSRICLTTDMILKRLVLHLITYLSVYLNFQF